MDAKEYEKATDSLERSMPMLIDSVKDNLDYLQNALKKRDLLDVEMDPDGHSGEFYSHYVELEAIHNIIDSLCYRILRSCSK